MPDAELIDEAEEFRAYPKSVQPGIPTLGDVPTGWRVLPMGKLLKVVQRPVKMVDDDVYQLVTARRNRGGLVARERLTGAKIATKTQFRVNSGDFVMSRRQIAHGACGILPLELDGALVSNEYAVLLPTDELNDAFLRHLPHSIYFQQTCFHSSIGVHVEKLVFNLGHWLTWPFLVPIPAEQRRIAAVLDAWDAAITSAERLFDALARRKRGIAFRLFGDGHNPFAVDGLPLEDIATVAYGKGVAPADYRLDSDVWVIGTQGLMAFSTRAQQHGPVIIVGRKGTLNRPMYVPPNQGFAAIDTTFILRAIDPAQSRALFHYLRYIDLAKLNEASGVPSVSADTLRSLPIPPLESRQSDILDACDIQIGFAEGVVQSLREQKRGLMQQLLTGQRHVPESIATLLPPAPELVAAE